MDGISKEAKFVNFMAPRSGTLMIEQCSIGHTVNMEQIFKKYFSTTYHVTYNYMHDQNCFLDIVNFKDHFIL